MAWPERRIVSIGSDAHYGAGVYTQGAGTKMGKLGKSAIFANRFSRGKRLETEGLSWSHPPGSNRRPADYESAALPTELGWLTVGAAPYDRRQFAP